jgi:hypothetical protein
MLLAFDMPDQTPAATLDFGEARVDATDTTSYSFATMDIGDAAADRVVIAVVVVRDTGSGSPVVAATLGGSAMTAGHRVDGTQLSIGIFYLAFPTGTTATLAVTTGGITTENCQVATYALYGLKSPVPTDFRTGSTTTSPSLDTLNIHEGGYGIYVCIGAHANAVTTGGITERYNNITSNTNLQVGDAPGGATVTATFTTAGASTPLAAAWR